jgi:hypothetical protein
MTQNEIETNEWVARNYAAPSPRHIKESVFFRNNTPNSIWVETGTNTGDTTYFLSKIASKVYSLEPAEGLFQYASERFKSTPNVELINGTSEDVFPQLIPQLSGNVNFWLDGHFSASDSYSGLTATPIREELRIIEKYLIHPINEHNQPTNRPVNQKVNRLTILVDDIRLFNKNYPENYPDLNYLVDWSRMNHLDWSIEHDIFVAKNY